MRAPTGENDLRLILLQRGERILLEHDCYRSPIRPTSLISAPLFPSTRTNRSSCTKPASNFPSTSINSPVSEFLVRDHFVMVLS